MQRRSYILLGLVFAALLGVLACLRMQERALIDFEQVEPIPGYKMEMREPPLRVAIISVLNHARTEGDQSRMVRSLGRLLGRPVLLLHRRSYAEINQLLAKGDADVAFLSSGAYMVYGKKEDVRLLAMPERNGASSYFSYVIVPRAGKAESLEELRGQRFVYFIRYGGATGLTGLMGYIIGSAFAGVYMGFVVDHFGWTGGFISLIASCVLSIFFLFMTMGGKKAT